jgi:hypothetical protein
MQLNSAPGRNPRPLNTRYYCYSSRLRSPKRMMLRLGVSGNSMGRSAYRFDPKNTGNPLLSSSKVTYEHPTSLKLVSILTL